LILLLLAYSPSGKGPCSPYSLFFSAKRIIADSVSFSDAKRCVRAELCCFSPGARSWSRSVLLRSRLGPVWAAGRVSGPSALQKLCRSERRSVPWGGREGGRELLRKAAFKEHEKKFLQSCLVKITILSERFEVQLTVFFFPLKHNKFVFCMLLGKAQLGKETEGKLLSACYECHLD